MLTLRAAGATATIAPELGGRLASLVVGGRERLVTAPAPDDASIGWGCYLMAPWPGRLDGARFGWQGRTIRLPRTHGRHAIHGLVWGRPWRVEARSASTATIACDLPRDEWPMGGAVRLVYRLGPSGLWMDASIQADDAMPAAIGWHPWFARGDEPIRLRLDADEVQETRRMIPTGRLLPASGRLDLRDGPLLGRRRLDHAYVGARSPAVLEWPDLRITLAFEPTPASVVVYTPPGAFCVEPQTAPPNALVLAPAAARAAGVRFLQPGEALAARLAMTWGDPRRAVPSIA